MKRLGDVCVLGLGDSGEAAARYCAGLLGSECDSVTVVETSDSQRVAERAERLRSIGVRVLLGTEAVSGCFDLCIASPGVPPHSALMNSARSGCTEVISEIEFAFRRSECAWVAVTGTNGKTTTTSLITHLLNEGGVSARAVGNIGVPAITAVAEGCPGEVLVAEVSSFQLALTSEFHPRVAVLLNITPDHLDWHGSMEAYAADKAKVFANLGAEDRAIVDVDDPGSRPWADVLEARGIPVARVSRSVCHATGGSAASGRLAIRMDGTVSELCLPEELRVRGPHNVSNALASALTAHAMGVGATDITRGLRSFEPIEHRLEPAGSACGLEWFNDSKATNPDAVFKAVEAFEEKPFVLLLGGRNKGMDFGPLARRVAGAARAVVLFGESREELARAFDGCEATLEVVPGLREAVTAAARLARPGDAVVLSPACASFDEFMNYEERGRAFKNMVAELACEVTP